MKVVGFRLRIKDKEELRLIRQRVEVAYFKLRGISEQRRKA